MFDVEAVHAGLSASPKRLDNHTLMYDERGSDLFDKICHEADYYTYRNDFSVFLDNAQKIAELVGPHAVLVDIGCGMCHKSIRILEAMEKPAGFVGLDIDPEVLVKVQEKLKMKFPELKVVTGVADFTKHMDIDAEGRKIGLMAGNSIAVYTESVSSGIVKNCLESLGSDGVFLASFDSNQDPETNLTQYTKTSYAELVLNALSLMNHEFGADFDLQSFSYVCNWNPDEKQVEHCVVSKKAQTVTLDGRSYSFEKDEALQIFFAKKWSIEDFKSVAENAGGVLKHHFKDADGYVRLVWIENA